MAKPTKIARWRIRLGDAWMTPCPLTQPQATLFKDWTADAFTATEADG